MGTSTTRSWMQLPARITQESIVFGLAVIMFVLFAVTLPRFAAVDNMLSLVRNVSILGIVSVGMAITVLGRGIDLSLVASMAMSVAWMILMISEGVSPVAAFALALAFALIVGVVNGVLIAYVEIPAVFTTLAMGGLVYGLGR